MEVKYAGNKTEKERRQRQVLFDDQREALQKKPDEAKRWKKDMVDPCKACAEIICMGICADRAHYKQEYREMTDRIRQQLINRNRRQDMDKKKLRQYRSLKREQKMLEDKMEKLNERAERIPAVIGKVKGSMDTFPYIETHMRIIMDEPKQADMIDRQMRINERRREQVDELLTEIEEFISQIPDSNTRQIFELIYLNGNTQQEVGDQLGYSKGRISQIISENLKD